MHTACGTWREKASLLDPRVGEDAYIPDASRRDTAQQLIRLVECVSTEPGGFELIVLRCAENGSKLAEHLSRNWRLLLNIGASYKRAYHTTIRELDVLCCEVFKPLDSTTLGY